MSSGICQDILAKNLVDLNCQSDNRVKKQKETASPGRTQHNQQKIQKKQTNLKRRSGTAETDGSDFLSFGPVSLFVFLVFILNVAGYWLLVIGCLTSNKQPAPRNL
jgi:hypothetical protein